MQNRHTPGRRTVPSLSIITADAGRTYHLSFITGPPGVQQWRANTVDKPTDYETLNRLIEQYRNRLEDLGWFMTCLKEAIAHRANKEDGCTGHFWESRYQFPKRQDRLC
jgi:hypothetical protein